MKRIYKFKSLKKLTAFTLTLIMGFSVFAVSANAAEISENVMEAQAVDVKEVKDVSTLPDKYSSLDMGYVTPAKTQSGSNCWVYSALATLESYLLKNTFNLPDFSTEHLDKWGTPNENGLGWQRAERTGALTTLPMGYFISRQGPFETYTDDNSQSAEKFAGYNINAIEYVNNENPKRMKELIYEYGAVSGNFNNSYRKYFDSTSTHFYCYDTNAAVEGHAISVVGWDDNYPKENFAGCGRTPTQDGAWLIKNSWGDYNNMHGFFWLSYEDVFAFTDNYSKNFAVKEVEEASPYEKLYQNEIYGATYDFRNFNENNQVTYINYYDFSDGYTALNKVIFETVAKGADYRVYYIPTKNEALVEDTAQWSLLASGTVDYDGYFSVDTGGFDLPLGYGGIGVTIDTTNVNQGVSPTSDAYVHNTLGTCEWLRQTGTSNFYFLNDSRYNESYVLSGDEFFDLKTYYTDFLDDDRGGTFAIKAETENLTKSEPTATLLGDADLSGALNIKDASMIQLYLASLKKSSVIRDLNSDFDQNGEINIVDVSDIQRSLSGII